MTTSATPGWFERSGLRAWAFKWALTYWPCYFGTGGTVKYIARDFSEARIQLKLGWRTRNYVGTIFGGSLYGCIDPLYMLLLMHRLGREFVVWDKAANIRFRRPGRGKLTARLLVPDSELVEIRKALESAPSVDRTYTVELIAEDGRVAASCDKTIYIARKKSATKAS